MNLCQIAEMYLRVHLVFFADLGVAPRTLADGAFLCRAVDCDETETWPEAFVPFEIVEE